VGGSLGILMVALAPSIPVVLVGWCIAQLLFNALLAALVAVLPDQVPATQRGLVSGFLGVCVPIASVSGTFLVQLFTGNRLAMFLAPCAIGGFFILLFAVRLSDRRLAEADKPTWSLREFASTFYVNPSRSPSPATSTVSWSAWPSAGSASACTWPSTWRSLSTCCRRSAVVATACCMRSPGSGPSSEPSPSCP
jgi:hypothetical protein